MKALTIMIGFAVVLLSAGTLLLAAEKTDQIAQVDPATLMRMRCVEFQKQLEVVQAENAKLRTENAKLCQAVVRLEGELINTAEAARLTAYELRAYYQGERDFVKTPHNIQGHGIPNTTDAYRAAAKVKETLTTKPTTCPAIE